MEEPFSFGLIVATRGRVPHLEARIPLWVASGFDEVIIVDGNYNPSSRARIRDLCGTYGARYVPAPRTFRDQRSFQRNLGARVARTTWLLFQDDDDDVALRIFKDVLAQNASGKDWMAGPQGEHIVHHRREAFLEFGGYPEDMVAAEDMIMSNRARGHGKGGLHSDRWYKGVSIPTTPREDPIGRCRNAFWYGYTMVLFMLRAPRRLPVLIGDVRRVAIFARMPFRGEFRGIVYLLVALFGRLLSPLHTLRVRMGFGPGAIKQEPYNDWQGLR